MHVLLLTALGTGSCALLPPAGPPRRIVVTATGEEIAAEQLAARLRECDVVFLGEVHDSPDAHELQLELTRRLHELHGEVTLSLEMFERDVQPHLDAYVLGRSTEAELLAAARPWSNYASAYRPAVEYARAHGLHVLAACLPRPAMDRWFAAQCAKDAAMAEAIADHLDPSAGSSGPVVHWCGRFHSDYGLGTVERLLERRPDLRIAVVTTVRRRNTLGELESVDRERAEYAFVVRE